MASLTGRSTSESAGRDVVVDDVDKNHHHHDSSSSEHDEKQPPDPTAASPSPPHKHPRWLKLPKHAPSALQWIPDNWAFSKIKPVIRCSVAAWISSVLFVIPKVEVWMGQASFLILIAAFLSPPSDSFPAVLEREMILLFFTTTAWAWCCLGIKLADLARTTHVPSATLSMVATGQYVEAAPSVIFGVFIFFGACCVLFIKARNGPGPYLAGCVLTCVCLDISITTACLYPYPFYLVGRSILIPLAFHSAIALLSSLLIFPSTASHQFTTRLQAVLSPLSSSLSKHLTILSLPSSPSHPEYKALHEALAKEVAGAEAALIPLAAAKRSLKKDVIWGRFAPGDFVRFQQVSRRLAVRANGMGEYWNLVDPQKEGFPTPTPGQSRSGTPTGSRTPSVHHGEKGERAFPVDDSDDLRKLAGHATTFQRASSIHSHEGSQHQRHSHPHVHHVQSHPHHHHSGHHSHHSHHNLLHGSLLHLAFSRTPHPHTLPHFHPTDPDPVGVFESSRYSHLSASHIVPSTSDDILYGAKATALLNQCCRELIGTNKEGVDGVVNWLGSVRQGRWGWVRKTAMEKQCVKREEVVSGLKRALEVKLERFRTVERHVVLEPYRRAFDPKHCSVNGEEVGEVPPHRYLFHCYVYCYHLIQFSALLIDMMDEIIKLEQERRTNRLWTPAAPLLKLLEWNTWQPSENVDKDDDEDPEVIPGMDPTWKDDLGIPHRRDPDALPPQNMFEWLMNLLHRGIVSLMGGNALFAIKAGILTVLLCLPSFFKASAGFAYRNKFIWVIFIGQLTLARFRGDTGFGFCARLLSTFFGGLVGMVMWYISTGSGSGSAYGLAAVFAVCYPFFFYGRLYWPGPLMTNIVFFVTATLVVAYSYQDIHILSPGSPGFGFSVAWRRFVNVVVGVLAAGIFSFFPPSTTIRCHQRAALATASMELGSSYCSILSFANSRHREADIQEIGTSLIAIRSKLKRTISLRVNVIYEFSLRGRWPAERYHKIVDLQLKVAYLLSHLMSTVQHLEPAWSRAFLRRTRFLDSDFQGDVLAVISLISTSLRTGTPLPQVTPCPLLDRFVVRYHGLNVIHKESEDDYGLPRDMTMDTLKNEQYLIFSVGVSTAYGIVTTLDRLMVATKELVGEQYHIHGIGVALRSTGVDINSRRRALDLFKNEV